MIYYIYIFKKFKNYNKYLKKKIKYLNVLKSKIHRYLQTYHNNFSHILIFIIDTKIDT